MVCAERFVRGYFVVLFDRMRDLFTLEHHAVGLD